MRRPSFRVVSWVVTILVAIAFISRVLRPAIPVTEQNPLADETSTFLRQAGFQSIDWHPLGTAAFAEARRRGLPVMLVIGAPWSRLGRDMDKGVFTVPEVQNYIDRNFVSIRIDHQDRPEWRSAFLPFRRYQLPIITGMQIWFLDPSGEMYDFLGRQNIAELYDEQTMLQGLINARGLYDRLQTKQTEFPQAGAAQMEEFSLLEAAGGGLPDFDAHDLAISRAEDAVNGGYPLTGTQPLTPNTWRYLLWTGQTEAMRTNLDKVLRTPIVDLVDGGFFIYSQSPDWKTINFDKLAVGNADMMRLLAQAGQVTGDRLYTELAERTFDTLASQFVGEGGYLAACRIGDEGELNRSARSSFSPRRLRELLTDKEREWTRDNLGLRVETNPQMTPMLANPQAFESPEFKEVLTKLRAGAGPLPPLAGTEYLDVNGFVAARLVEVARIWNDRARLEKALDLVSRLSVFKGGNDVAHQVTAIKRTQPYLGDYLAFADAHLAAYLATSRPAYLTEGADVLRRALFLFKGSRPGLYALAVRESALGPRNARSPEILDLIHESCTAQLIRICQAYGEVVQGMPGQDHTEFAAVSNAATELFGRFTADIGPPASGYFCAAVAVRDSRYAVVAGPRALELSNALVAKLPTRLVIPAAADVRSDIGKRKPGIYVVQGSSVKGPLTLDQAVSDLTATYAVSPQ